MTGFELRGFYFLLGGLVLLLILGRKYRGLVRSEKPRNVTPMRKASGL